MVKSNRKIIFNTKYTNFTILGYILKIECQHQAAMWNVMYTSVVKTWEYYDWLKCWMYKVLSNKWTVKSIFRINTNEKSESFKANNKWQQENTIESINPAYSRIIPPYRMDKTKVYRYDSHTMAQQWQRVAGKLAFVIKDVI